MAKVTKSTRKAAAPDYQVKDIDNDGQNEVVIALVLSVGISLQEKSVIVAYKLTPQEGAKTK